jgi:hypothetical protein
MHVIRVKEVSRMEKGHHFWFFLDFWGKTPPSFFALLYDRFLSFRYARVRGGDPHR